MVATWLTTWLFAERTSLAISDATSAGGAIVADDGAAGLEAADAFWALTGGGCATPTGGPAVKGDGGELVFNCAGGIWASQGVNEARAMATNAIRIGFFISLHPARTALPSQP